MKPSLLVTAIFACAAIACSAGGSDGDGDTGAQAIVGGQSDANDRAVVAITTAATGMAVCSGTLIAPGVVLTAGHCPTVAIWVCQGADVRSPGWFDHVAVDSVAKHPAYSGEGGPTISRSFACTEASTA